MWLPTFVCLSAQRLSARRSCTGSEFARVRESGSGFGINPDVRNKCHLFPPSLFSSFTSTFYTYLVPCSPPFPGTLPYDIKIVIAGNHELTFDQEFMADLIKQDFYYFPSASKLKPENYENVQSLLTNCIYLQDSEVTVRGFRIYGSPWWVIMCRVCLVIFNWFTGTNNK